MFPFGSLIATYLKLTASPTRLLILLRPALPTGFLISVHGICDLPVLARDLWCHSRFLFFFFFLFPNSISSQQTLPAPPSKRIPKLLPLIAFYVIWAPLRPLLSAPTTPPPHADTQTPGVPPPGGLGAETWSSR